MNPTNHKVGYFLLSLTVSLIFAPAATVMGVQAPFISDVRVRADSRNAVISFSSTQSTPALVEIGKVPPKPDRFGIIAFPFNSGAFSRFVTGENGRYTLSVDLQNEELQPGTTYYYIINVFNNNRNDTKKPREQVAGNFGTAPQMVKVFFDRVRIEDDSDEWSTGECTFWFWANYGEPTATHTKSYYNGDMDTGGTYRLNRSLVINNAPDLLKLAVSGYDADGTFTTADIEAEAPLGGPSGAFMSGNDKNVATGEFDLTKSPGTTAGQNFRLESRGGRFRFVVSGHIEITRLKLGSTGSALETNPDPVGIRPGGRVKLGGSSTGPSRTICESAQVARARNSAAAPGLEAKCVAIVNDLAVKGQTIALQDPAAATLRITLPDTLAQRGFDIGLAAAGGDTENGPGKQAIHNALKPAEQAGFTAAVSFALERNRIQQTKNNAALAKKGEAIANRDPLTFVLRNLQPEGPARRGFDIGMAAAERDTEPGLGKQRIHDSLSPAEQQGFTAAVTFLLAKNKNPKEAAVGAAIAKSDVSVGRARNADTDPFYQLGFDIATGLFGDPAKGTVGSTQLGTGALAIRSGLTPAGQRGFDASAKFHFSRSYR
jgi:hypothetical protein